MKSNKREQKINKQNNTHTKKIKKANDLIMYIR